MSDRRQTHVGIARFAISSDTHETLIASSLGSCLGMAIFDPVGRNAAMIHCLVPLKGVDHEKIEQQPAFSVESGVPMILEALLKRGAQKKDLVIVLAGCAQINTDNSMFEIGKKNLTVCKKILWKNSLLIKAEHCGGDFSRTLSMEVGSGRVTIKSRGVIEEVSEARV